MYIAFPIPHTNGSHLILFWVSDRTDWVHLPPYSDSGGALLDSQPIYATVEFFVTPFDRLIWGDPEQSLVSDLNAGKTIRFFVRMIDTDTEPLQADRYHDLLGPGASYDGSLQQLSAESDLWAHGILLGADGGTDGTAVESVSWARIKASLSE